MRWLKTLSFTSLLVGGATLVSSGCSGDVEIGAFAGIPDAVITDAATDAARADAEGDGSAFSCQQSTCQGKLYDCGDCLDNDSDGLIDSQDPDCLGPCHNAEDTFFGSIPGQNAAPCSQDCYFDNDTGGGNDGCSWDHRCDPLSVEPDFPPEGERCAYNPEFGDTASCSELSSSQSNDCLNSCLPLVPNGCDCFGCCSVPGENRAVWLGSIVDGTPSCSRATLDDPTQCRPCTQVKSCLNPCEHCELCLGKPSLPDDCQADGGTAQCAGDQRPCGLPDQDPCGPGTYCITGCCVKVIQ